MALGSIGGIVVKVSADTTQFTQGMNRVGTKLATNAKQLRQSSLQYQKWAAVGVTAAAAVGVAMVKSQLNTLDVLAKTSDALKIQQERLQALQHVAALTGTSAAQLGVNLERMQRRIGEVARKGGLAGKALEEIGIQAKDLIDLSADEQLVQISRALGGMENASLRASIAMDLFGRDGVRMLKMLEQLKDDGLDGTVDELQNLGIALSRIDTSKVEQANDAMFKSQQVVEGIINKVAVRVSPILEAMANGFTDAAKEAKGFGSTVDSSFNKMLTVIGVFADGLHGINIIFAGLKVGASAIAVVVNEAFRIMAKGAEGFVNFAIRGINQLMDAINTIPGVAIPAIERFESSAANMMQDFSDRAKENLVGSIDDLHNKLMEKLPSQALDEFVAEAEAASQALAEKLTKGKEKKVKGGLTQEEIAALNEKIDVIRESLKTERQLKDEAFAADIEAIRAHGLLSEEAKAEADALELARVEKHAAELIAISERAADAEKRIEEAKNRAKLAAAGNAFGDLSSLMNSGSKKVFEIGKKAAIASAAISGTQAAIDAWKSGMQVGGPTAPLFAAAYTAASLVKTGSLISKIKSQSFGGGGGNATSFSGGLPAVNTQSAPQQQQAQTVDVRVTAAGGGIVDMFNFEVANGASPIMG